MIETDKNGMVFNKFILEAIKLSRGHEYDTGLQAYLTALIVSGGKILSVGFNGRDKASSGLQRRYSQHNSHRASKPCTIHAEIDAVLNCRRKIDLTGSKVFVIRRLRLDSVENPLIAMAKPCPMCQAVLFSYGVRRATYTISNNEFGVLNLTDPRK